MENQTLSIGDDRPLEEDSKGRTAFLCFLIWTFVLIGRPQDYFSFLALIRPVLMMTVLTLLSMIFSGVQWPKDVWKTRELRLLFMFLIIMFVGIPFAVHKGVAFNFVFKVFPRILLYFFVFLVLVNSAKRLYSLLWTAVAGSVFLSLNYIKDTIFAGNLASRFYASQMYDPNDIAFVFATYLPLVLYFFMVRHTVGKKLVFLLAALSMAAGIIISQSRGGILALLVIFAALLFFKTEAWKGRRKFLVVVLLSGLLIYYLPLLEARFQNLSEDYNVSEEGGRLDIWKDNLIIFSENPLSGVGANCSTIALGLYRSRDPESLQAWQVAHSSVIQVGVETGVPGLLVFLFLNISTLLNFRRARKENNSELSQLPFFLELSFYGFWVGALFLTHGYSIHLYILFAASAAIRTLKNKSGALVSPLQGSSMNFSRINKATEET